MKIFDSSMDGFVGKRLDNFLTNVFSELSRSKIQKFIRLGEIRVNENLVKPGYLLGDDDKIFVKDLNVNDTQILPEDIDLDIVYEDDDTLVINKIAGMVVHPGEGDSHISGTVVNAILNRIQIVDEERRPGIVHRLDKETSGLLIVAKSVSAREFYMEQFKKRRISKNYLALVLGELKNSTGIIDSPIARDFRNRKRMAISSEGRGKKAISHFQVLEVFEFMGKKLSLVNVEIKTGRTHQIRVHMAAIGHPLVGDSVYGNRQINDLLERELGLKRQFLHAAGLGFVLFSGGRIQLSSRLPSDLEVLIEKLREK